MANNLTREKVSAFLMDYQDDEYKMFLEDFDCEEYKDLPNFAKGTLYGLELARVAIMNAEQTELETRG